MNGFHIPIMFTFQLTIYIYNAVEKDENETKVLLNNGKTVYVFGNLDTQDIMWTEGQSEFNLSGNIENETVPNSV